MAESEKKKSAEGGGNPNVPEGAFGGARDAIGVTGLEHLFPGAFEGPSLFNYNMGMGEGAGAEGVEMQRKKLEAMVNMWRDQLAAKQAMQVRPAEEYEAQAKAQDPVRFAEQRRAASLADPFGPGGYFEGRRAADLYTPEQIVASGGMTAENQLRSQQKKTDTFDPEQLRRLNEQYRHTYV